MLNIKKLLTKLTQSIVHTATFSLTSQTLSGDWRGTKAIPISLPSGAQIVGVTIKGVPNGHWVRAQIGYYTNNEVAIYCHNEYTGNISGDFTVAVAYKLVADSGGDAGSLSTGSYSAANGFSASELKINQRGGTVFINGYFTRSSNIGTSEISIGTFSGVSLPTSNIRFLCGTGANAYSANHACYAIFTPSGNLSILAATSTDKVVDICLSYTL